MKQWISWLWHTMCVGIEYMLRRKDGNVLRRALMCEGDVQRRKKMQVIEMAVGAEMDESLLD